MCGLVGVAGWQLKKSVDAFNQLLVFDSVRGTHSTGICAITNNLEGSTILKVADTPFGLFEHGKYDKVVSQQAAVLMGHNRYATVGSVNKKNAHPFDVGPIIGMHNGSLHNKHDLKDGHSFAVDSEALLNHIAHEGVQDAVDKADGAFSLVWWDSRDKTVNFLRNTERPLFYTYSKDNKLLFWASEEWMLWVAAARNEIAIGDIVSSIPYAHYTLKLSPGGVLGAFEYTELVKPAPKGKWYGSNFSAGRRAELTVVTDPSPSIADMLPEKVPVQDIHPGTFIAFKASKICRDAYGGMYIRCERGENPQDIRWYVNKKDPVGSYLNRWFTGVVTNARFVEGENRHPYLKLDYGSVKLVKPEEKEEPAEKPATTFRGHDSRDYSEDAWRMKYGTCAWCSSSVDPHKSHILTSNGDALCESCCKDPDTVQLITPALTHLV